VANRGLCGFNAGSANGIERPPLEAYGAGGRDLQAAIRRLRKSAEEGMPALKSNRLIAAPI